MAKDYGKTVTSGFIWTFAERISAQGVSFLVSIILARLLSPNEYGIISIVLIIIAICNVLISDGLGSALIQKKDAEEIDFSTLLIFGVVVSIVLYIALFFFAPLVERFYGLNDLSVVIRVMAFKLPISAVNTIQQAIVSRRMAFKKFFIATSIGTIISGIIGIAMAYLGFGVWSLVVQYLTNSFIDTILLGIVIKWIPSFKFSYQRLKGLLHYGWKILAAGLLEQIYQELRSLVIGKKYSEALLAFYTKGKQFPNLIVNNINAAITKTLFPAISNKQNVKNSVKEMTRKSIRVGTYVITPILVGMAVCAESLVAVLLTAKWLPCVIYLQVFSIASIVRPISTANLQAIKAIGRSDTYLKIEIIKRVIGVLILVISVVCFDSVFAILIGYLIASYIGALINFFPNISLLDYRIKEQLYDIAEPFIFSIVMGVAVLLVRLIPAPELTILLIQVVVGVIVYLVLSIVCKSKNFIYIREILKSFKKKEQ